MTTNQRIELSHETRMWITQVIMPIVGVIAVIPEIREPVIKKIRTDYQWLKEHFNK